MTSKVRWLLFIGCSLILVGIILVLPMEDNSPKEVVNLDKVPEASAKANIVNKELEAAEENALKQPDLATILSTATAFDKFFESNQDSSLSLSIAEKAIFYYQKALDLDPTNLEAKTGLGWFYTLTSPQPMKGIMLLREVVSADPNNEKAQYALGLLSMKSQQFEKAISRFEIVKKINNQNFNVNLQLSDAYLASGNQSKALSVLQEVTSTCKDEQVVRQAQERILSLTNKK